MRNVFKLVLQGLGTVLPLGLTLYALWWLATTLEEFARQALLIVLPNSVYFPGLGLMTALGTLFAIGLMMNLYGLRYLVSLGDRLVQKIPLAKSVYGSIKDIITVFNLGNDSELNSVVSVDMGNGMQQIGFVTGVSAGKRLFPDEGKVGVYLPMSYQIGGFTMYLDRDRIKPLDISVEEAMRIALTGGARADKTEPGQAPARSRRSPPGDAC